MNLDITASPERVRLNGPTKLGSCGVLYAVMNDNLQRKNSVNSNFQNIFTFASHLIYNC
jgi:hypothetical protein